MKKKKNKQIFSQESRKAKLEGYAPPRLTRHGRLKEHTTFIKMGLAKDMGMEMMGAS